MTTILDIETRSALDLTKVGPHRYAEDPSTEIVCESSVLFGPPGPVIAHNAMFERAVLNAKSNRHLFPEIMDCTLARALAVGLPASLEMAGAALKLPIQKDKAGRRLMLKMCKPKKVHDDGRIEWHDNPDDLRDLQAYCDRDVATEAALCERLPRLSERERKVWVLDQTINDRGVRVDVRLVQKALAAVVETKRRADRKLFELTNGAATSCTQTARIAAWVRSRGVPCDSIAKGEVEEIVLRSEVLDEPLVEEVIALRRQAVHMFRFDKILTCVCRDDRLRGLFQYHKAATGRWAGWTQSFPRVDAPEAVEAALAALAVFTPEKAVDLIDAAYGRPAEVLSECHRPMIVASPGFKLVGGDFSNIEGRVGAWYADERWKLDAFELYDSGRGPDLYRLMAAGVLGTTPEAVDALHRQSHGKVPELACGYQGHVGAFQKMAHTQTPPVKVSDADARAIVTRWRDQNVRIVQSWWDLQDAAIQAVEAAGLVVPVLDDKIRYVSDGKFLYCRLPSGRTLHYASPSVRWRERVIKTEDGDEIVISRGVTYFGVDFGAKWGPIDLYGGMQFNHVVQGLARDLLVEAMFRVEAAGYPIVHHTHDDLLCEVPIGFGSPEAFAELMAELPAWAEGLPVTVKAWEGDRWLK